MKCIKSILFYVAIALSLGACERSGSEGQQAAAQPKSDLELYNESVSTYRQIAPKGELETTEQYLARKKQAVASIEEIQYKVRIPAAFSKCAEQDKEAPPGTDTYVGLLYDADRKKLQVCPLEFMKTQSGDSKESIALVRTSTITSYDSYKGRNLFGVEREIEAKTIESIAIMTRWEDGYYRHDTAISVEYSLESAKLLHGTGAFLVYDVRVVTDKTGPIEIEKKKMPTISDPVQITERIRGYLVKVNGIALEDKAGTVIAHFAMQKDTWHLAHVEAPDAKVQPVQISKTKTRYGDFIINNFGEYWKGELFRKGATGHHMSIDSLQRFGEQDIALAFLGGEGTSGHTSFGLIVFTPDGRAKLLQEDGSAKHMTPVVKRNDPVHKRLEIDLGYREKQRVTAIYDMAKLTLIKEDAKPIALPDEVCQDLHVTYQACAETQVRDDESCNKRSDSLSQAQSGGLWQAYDFPGNDDHHLKAYCDKVCKTNQVLAYPAFKKVACNPQIENAGLKRVLEDELLQ